MLRGQILKKFLIPGSVLSAAAVKDAKSEKDADKRLRASELPIYTGEHCRPPKRDPCSERSSLEEAIGAVRKELWVWYDQCQGYRQKIIEVVEVGKAHTESTLEYLKEESNYMPRVGAIGLSGVAGYVLGMRGGMVRRLLYASVASLTMAGLCYPRYGAEASKEALFYVKKACAITYNFVYGVKPDGLKLPHPSSLLEDGGTEKHTDAALATVPGHVRVPVRESPDQAMSNLSQSNPADSDLYTNRR
ncbi:MICOS complex subunit MIC27 isoform X2 [Anabrus simplex]|uniref:MICOS complex subunit MIC27 isoform X2 n=1 Tax=Anabrus simplex TaxID=316456 RepID=UPI0035A36CB5